jgi:hypothetical protein
MLLLLSTIKQSEKEREIESVLSFLRQKGEEEHFCKDCSNCAYETTASVFLLRKR